MFYQLAYVWISLTINDANCNKAKNKEGNQFISLNSLSIAFAFDIESHKFMIKSLLTTSHLRSQKYSKLNFVCFNQSWQVFCSNQSCLFCVEIEVYLNEKFQQSMVKFVKLLLRSMNCSRTKVIQRYYEINLTVLANCHGFDFEIRSP